MTMNGKVKLYLPGIDLDEITVDASTGEIITD